MKRKTLQEQYNQIKKGKGSKEIFLKEAKKTFPNYIHNIATFNQAEKILRQKSIISENMWGIATGKTEQPDWFKIFNENIDTINEEAKVEEKKTSKEVTDLEEKNFDYKDKKDVNNVYGEAFLKGYYTEMKDPKNDEKTVNEIKEIVAKNLAKDQLHYVKEGQFGEKGVGYTDEHPGLKASKSDQMEKVKLKESKNITEGKKYFGVFRKGGSIGQGNDKPLYSFVDKEEAKQRAKRLRQSLSPGEKSYYGIGYIVKPTDIEPESLKENLDPHDSKKVKPKKKKAKKETIETKLAEIDRASSMVALETKIEALAEIIESKMQRLSMVSEDENLSELMDKKKIKEMQREIKLLEKRKAGFEKLYEKSCGSKYQKQEIVGEVTEEEEITESSKSLKLNEISKREAENLKKLEQFKKYAKEVMGDHDGDFSQKDIDNLTHKDRIAYGRNNEITIEDYIKEKNKKS